MAAEIRIVQMYQQAMPLRQPMTGPRLSTNLQRQMPGCGGSFFHMLLVFFHCFFANRAYSKLYHTAWQHRESLASPGFLQNRPGRRPGCGGNGFQVVIRRFSLLFFLNHGFGIFITQPVSSQGPLQPPGSPQIRPGRLPGCGGNGFHVIYCFS